MKSLSFRKDLVGVQDELLRFAYIQANNRPRRSKRLVAGNIIKSIG